MAGEVEGWMERRPMRLTMRPAYEYLLYIHYHLKKVQFLTAPSKATLFDDKQNESTLRSAIGHSMIQFFSLVD